MKLVPVDQRPGVWINPSWRPGTPGTFAIVIGVSAYQYLDGSNQQFGLGQLPVSALTARNLFDWLEESYSRTGSPIAMAWLLLSPDDAELKTFPDLATNSIEPTFRNCEDLIQEWYAEMEALPKAAAQESRSLFFFSGHGLEVTEDRQILLPSDYLKPNTPIDRALSTENISRGLKALNLPLHFLFLDACRNDHNNLGNFGSLRGTRVLNEPSNRTINPDCLVPIFYASASGESAYSPAIITDGPSLFGQALLEGMRAQGLPPDCDSKACFVYLYRLRPFVEKRIAELIRDRYHGTVTQRAKVRGDQTEEPVTEVARPAQPPSPPPPGPPSQPDRFHYLPQMMVEARGSIVPASASVGEIHSFFGSEDLTEIFAETLYLRDLTTGEDLNPKSLEVLDLRRAQDTSIYDFDLQLKDVPPGHTCWLQVQDLQNAVGCLIPTDRFQNTRFSVELDTAFSPRRIIRFDVSVSKENEGPLGSAAGLWQQYELLDARQALKSGQWSIPVHGDELHQLLRHKRYSPLAAMIAGMVLIRARDWKRLHDWLRNLANLAPEIPDGAVLWAEQCLRKDQRDAARVEALEYFMRLDGGMLPITGEGLGYALLQAEEFTDDESLSEEVRSATSRIHTRLQRAVALHRPGGLFSTFIGEVERISVELLPSLTGSGFKPGTQPAPISGPQPQIEYMLEASEFSEHLNFRSRAARGEIAPEKKDGEDENNATTTA